MDSIPVWGRSPGEGNGTPLQYSCLRKSHGQRNLEGYSPWGHRVRHDLATKRQQLPQGLKFYTHGLLLHFKKAMTTLDPLFGHVSHRDTYTNYMPMERWKEVHKTAEGLKPKEEEIF